MGNEFTEFTIDVTTFVNMFVAISYLQEQRIFSYKALRKYFRSVYWSDDTADFCYDDLISELDTVLDKMVEDEIISPIDQNLYFITDKINYKEIIENNHDGLKDMMEVFYNIQGGKEKVIYIIPSKSNQKNKPLL